LLLEHEDGDPGGLCGDAEGGLWVALAGAGEVRRFDPSGGVSEVVELPVSRPTSCCFGGAGLATLFITTSRDGITTEEEPEAGSVFCCTPGTAGAEVPGFAG
ncbi:MAG: SMP-30/gluconolactonase/LRE family protein, partial [Propionicimonas sp.]|nr:SMP-30/gluconolactonase/LRE family protein [Propionicimonas sp.]